MPRSTRACCLLATARKCTPAQALTVARGHGCYRARHGVLGRARTGGQEAGGAGWRQGRNPAMNVAAVCNLSTSMAAGAGFSVAETYSRLTSIERPVGAACHAAPLPQQAAIRRSCRPSTCKHSTNQLPPPWMTPMLHVLSCSQRGLFALPQCAWKHRALLRARRRQPAAWASALRFDALAPACLLLC